MSRLTPWADSQEWMEIYAKLYSNDSNEQWNGVNRVKAWSSRGKIPHSVEATATFVQVGLRLPQMSIKESSMLLSMALIRFVNGIVDSAQKGNIAVSAVGIAEQMELPLWFVELRHQATHDRTPPLNQLKRAQSQALNWLDTHYWKVQATAVQDTTELIASYLKEYKQLRLEYLSKPDSSFQKIQKVLGWITSTLTFDNFSDILIPLLLQVDMLVPSAVSEQVDYNTEFLDEDDIVLLWEPLLTCCEVQWSGFSGILLQSVMDGYSQSVQHQPKLYWPTLSTWCKFVLKRFMVPWNAYDQIGIVKSFLVNSNALSLDLLAYLDHIQEIPDRLKPFYDYLLSRTKVNTKDISSVEIDLQKLNQDLQELSSRIPKVEEIDTEMQEQVQGWELVSGWQKCPIGVLPGSATVGNLDLDPSYDDAVYFEPVIPISSSTIETKLIPTVVLL